MNASLKTTRQRVSEAEWNVRVQLAAAYRLLAHFGVNDLTYNHLSARVPDAPNQYLVKPTTFMFDEVTASTLQKFDFDGQPFQDSAPSRGGAFVIHAGILSARPDVNVIFHTHTTANTAVSAQEEGLMMLSQHAMAFYKRVAYHRFGGFEFNLEQREPLLRDLGHCRYAILRNHGALVCGHSVPQTFVDHHFLEMACRAQVAALAGGRPVTTIEPEVCEYAAVQYEGIDPAKSGSKDWAACIRLLDRVSPGYDE
ncbi:class II aldolase/adducin family protein [Variovorax sp. RA8]|uniref:class II aldolase/adducin family protein n=1 Tax=Variovorax sp. (strain JCM 16519 / RA8) TaxID=662548 RepID=UPI000B3237C6|nr:class II aldolase/adducin family protein [Variovorax sp. RA8]VTU28662.1 L-fuculose phosphate aldolase [Variovorax sp. RA8]